MIGKSTPLGAAALASATAGPVFLIAYAFATLLMRVPQPIVIGENEAVSFFMVIWPASVVGFFLAILPSLIGTSLLSDAARGREFARMPEAWVVAGAASGALIAAAFGAEDAIAFALVATSASCAGVCRMLVRLD